MKHFPPLWLSRLNETVMSVRRRHGWMDIQAAVEPPQQRGQPPLLRLERSGALVLTPLDLRAVELMMRTGQQGPILIEIKQAFLRFLKTAQRRERARQPSPLRRGGRL